jgi:TorA maturation chaperone TorD
MSISEDKQLVRIRLRLLDLLKSFFAQEPDAERMSRWRGIFTALAENRIQPDLDEGVRQLRQMLEAKKLEDLKDEYYALFVDPYNEQPVELNASHYLDGKSFGPSLVQYRQLLKDASLIKENDVTEPEDHLVLMLDALATLIEEEAETKGCKEQQARLITEFLQPMAIAMKKQLSTNSQASFYLSCSVFLNGYLDLEQGLLEIEV